ncbi:MAG: RIP metalloprotease RseP [Rhizobiales bacterium]|nr:RIP metalloprotease RseP [Hyphomicrobiales bacterium]
MDFLSLLNLPVFYVLPFLAALTVIIFIHELGHFLVARWFGVAIETFSIGFGREIAGWYDRHGTRWKLCWVLLGGYVKFKGDANAASQPERDSAATREPGNFHGKPVWQRALIVVAGPVANFILAILIFAGGYAFVGMSYLPPLVAGLSKDGAAEKIGILTGDLIVSIDGRKLKSFQDIREAVLFRAGERLDLVVDRQGQTLAFAVAPQETEEIDAYGRVTKTALLGIEQPGRDKMLVEQLSLPQAGAKAVERTGYIITTTVKYIGRIFVGKENGSKIGGAITVAKIAGEAASLGLYEFMLIIGIISVSIGLINLFPIPMLDGGHLVLYGIEAVLGKPVGANVQEWSFRIGLSLVLMLMVMGLVNDIGWITK